MNQFENVTVVKPANFYFDGKVTSRTVIFEDGSKKTLGIMLPGEYEFGTDAAEEMEMMAGKVEVLLPGSDTWQIVEAGETFNVPANSKFGIRVIEIADYCCSYLD
jgi:uncharacterized protein YaiE (UPF0345 family)